jgi:hypothetical protein
VIKRADTKVLAVRSNDAVAGDALPENVTEQGDVFVLGTESVRSNGAVDLVEMLGDAHVPI